VRTSVSPFSVVRPNFISSALPPSSLPSSSAARFAADWIPLLVGMLLCARQPQLRYSSEASLLQTLQLLRELLYHLLLLLHLFL